MVIISCSLAIANSSTMTMLFRPIRSNFSNFKRWKSWREEKPNRYVRLYQSDTRSKMPFSSLPSWNIPQELLDYIIDFLHDDYSALTCCSSVSRQWHTSTRYHLFSSIKLCGRQKFADFIGYVRTPQLAFPSLRELQLIGQYPNLRQLVDIKALSAILGALPHLTHLSLAHLHLTNDIGISEPIIPSALPPRFKLEYFSLRYAGGVPHHSAEHFLKILALFSEINTLWLEYNRFDHRSLVASDIGQYLDKTLSCTIPKELRVKKLVIHDMTFETKFWLEMLRRTATTHSMTSLDVRSHVRWEMEVAGLLLAAVGSNLTHSLKLDLSGLINAPAHGENLYGSLC
jgi:hypothetical protein